MIPNGINLDKALQIARRLGCEVGPIRRTGEIKVAHPEMVKPCSRINGRSRNSTRRLIGWLRRLSDLTGPTGEPETEGMDMMRKVVSGSDQSCTWEDGDG